MPRTPTAALLALATLTSGCLPGGPGAVTASPVPGLEVSGDESCYEVAGLNARDLNHELSRRGPSHEGRSWQGQTDFRVAYSYSLERGADGCRAAEPRVRVGLVTTLPRWRDRDDAPERLRSDWDLYLSRLEEHEEGHRRIAILAGQELLEDVSALEAPDCEALRRTATEVAESYQKIVALEQKGWDEETAHGLDVGN